VTMRRRAQEFHDLVEGSSPDRASSYGDLLEVVGGLRAAPAPVADPAFVAHLRDLLITEAETVRAAAAAVHDATEGPLRQTRPGSGVRRRNRRLAAAVTGVVLVGGSATMAVASQSALPGDALYPIKRDIESAHAGLTFDRAGRGEVLLRSASSRLDEAEALTRADADPARVDEALDGFTSEAIAGSDLLIQDYRSSGDDGSVTTVRTFTASSMGRLHDLEPVIPGTSLPRLLTAAQALDQIESAAVTVCPDCSGPLVTSVPSVLAEALDAATRPWATGMPDAGQPGQPGHHHHRGHHGPSSAPHPPQGGGNPPTVGDTPPPTSGSDVVSGSQVQHILHDIGGVTGGDQNAPGSTATDAPSTAVDEVGQAGSTVTGPVTGTIGGTVGDVASALPSAVPTNLPSLP
jgi:Domain of unknown function (DUF5667)